MDVRTTEPTDESSRRYEGWRIVGVTFWVATFGWALGFYGQSIYLAELQRLYAWPASVVSGATTFFYLVGAVLVAFVGDAMRRFGPRACLLVGVVTMALATVALGRIATIWELYLGYAFLALGWAGTSLGAVTNTLGLWFDKKRGMAISLALNGASFGGIAGVPLLALLISSYGFATATLVAAVVMVAVLIPAILFIVGNPPRRPPLAVGESEDSAATIRRRAFRDSAFVTMTGAFALVLFAQVGFLVHLVSFLDPILGREKAAAALSLATVMAVVGRLSVSTFIDRVDQRRASAVSFLSQSIALVAVIVSRNEIVLFGACMLFGFSVGNLITLPALLVQREHARHAFGTLVSLVTSITQIAYAFGPVVVGIFRDAIGSYGPPFAMCIVLQIAAAVLILIRRRVA